MTEFSRLRAEALGWRTWNVEPGATATAVRDRDGHKVVTASSTPVFHALVNIAEMEGEGFAQGYGGTEEINSALIMAVSGETYVDPPPEPEPEPDLADPAVLAAAVRELAEAFASGNAAEREKATKAWGQKHLPK